MRKLDQVSEDKLDLLLQEFRIAISNTFPADQIHSDIDSTMQNVFRLLVRCLTPKEATALAYAKRWLAEALTPSVDDDEHDYYYKPDSIDELRKEAKEQGISKSTLDRAAKALGATIERHPVGGYIRWVLPKAKRSNSLTQRSKPKRHE